MLDQKRISWKHRAQYYETDQMGIVHHSNYIRWFEEARVEFLNEIDWGYDKLEAEGIISPVIGVSAEYKSMVHFNDEVEIWAHISSFDGVRLTITYQVLDAQTKELRAKGTSSHCFLGEDNFPLYLKRKYPEFYQVLKDLVLDSTDNA